MLLDCRILSCALQDWGMTLVCFYRELFPMFVAALFHPLPSSLSARAAVSLLLSCNYVGSVAGQLPN